MSLTSAQQMRVRLREVLSSAEISLAPSCGDAITARLIESLGLPAVHCSGSALHRQAGYADAGILTMTEMAAAVSLMTSSVYIPVIADADTGFGGVANVVRTVREYERAGAAAMHIEDQLTPKRPPGAGASHSTISRQEMVDKIAAAVDAREDETFVIIARSEVKGDDDEVIERLGECFVAGADAAWLSADTPQRIERYRAALPGPLIGVLPRNMNLQDYGRYGANLAVLPTLLETVASYAKKRLLEELIETGDSRGYLDTLPGIEEMREFVQGMGADEMKSLEERFEH